MKIGNRTVFIPIKLPIFTGFKFMNPICRICTCKYQCCVNYHRRFHVKTLRLGSLKWFTTWCMMIHVPSLWEKEGKLCWLFIFIFSEIPPQFLFEKCESLDISKEKRMIIKLFTQKTILSPRRGPNPQPSDDRWDALTIEPPWLRWWAKVQVPYICAI